MAKGQKTVVYARGALGLYHSVPQSRLKEYGRAQKRLESSGTLDRELRRLNARAAELMKK